MKVAIYLRKSRADEEIEKELGQGETLARHRKALLRLAKEKDYTIVNIYEELVSGEELYFRPAMLDLLKDSDSGIYEAVLVMDIQRLGRGDMEEQGLILKTFKKANVKIITPQKVYDLNNEFDEEYSEFEAFMSRKEYKMITRRMQGGRVRSVEEGNYIATLPPYGYDIVKIDKRTRSLIPNPEQSQVVQMIFNWYVVDNKGCGSIATELDKLGIKSYTGVKWDRTVISSILKNQSYIGKVVWKKKCIRKSKTLGKKKDVYTRDKDKWIVSEGKHDPIIDFELFKKAQVLLSGKYHVPYQLINGVSNSLAGLIICGICGKKMKRRPYQNAEAHLICESKCGIKSNKYSSVEKRILEELKKTLNELEIQSESVQVSSNSNEIAIINFQINELNEEMKKVESQKSKSYDFLEQGIYDINTFTERSNTLADKIADVTASIQNCKTQIIKLTETDNQLENSILKLRHVLDAYTDELDPKERNLLLKSVIEKVVYYKEKGWSCDKFDLIVHHKTVANK